MSAGMAELMGDARAILLTASNLYLAIEDVRRIESGIEELTGELLEGLDAFVRKLEAYELATALQVAATIPSPPPPAPDDDECPPTDPMPGLSTLDVKDPEGT